MDNNTSYLNNNPIEKLKYLKTLLLKDNLSSQQINKIKKIIRDTIIQLKKIKQQQNNSRNNPSNNPSNNPRNNSRNNPSNNVTSFIPIGTKDLTHKGKELIKLNQEKNYNEISNKYYSEEEKQEAEFNLKIQKERDFFKQEQLKRRLEYQAKLKEIEISKIDALDLFNLNANYTVEELKYAYKLKAMETHPDRPNGDKTKFQTVTKCYMSLLEKLKLKESDKQFNDLKSESFSFLNTQKAGTSKSRDSIMDRFYTKSNKKQYVDSKSFNITLFNKLYEQNKLWDPNDDGYEDWFRNGKIDKKDKAPEVFGHQFNVDIFNATFDNFKDNNSGKEIVEYTDPRELILTTVGHTNVDNTVAIKNFSKNPDVANGLGYSDLKEAYTGGANLVNPNRVKSRDDYRNIDDLKKARSDINYIMSPEDMAKEAKKKNKEAQDEIIRQERIRNNDLLTAEHYKKSHMNLLGYKGSPDA